MESLQKESKELKMSVEEFMATQIYNIKNDFLKSAGTGDTAYIKEHLDIVYRNSDAGYRTAVLTQAIKGRNVYILSYLISNGFSVTNDLLFVALENLDDPIIDLLLQKGCSVKQFDILGCPPADFAVYQLTESSTNVDKENCTQIVKKLVEKGGDIFVPDRNGSVPLHRAIKSGYVPLIEFLLQHGGIQYIDYYTAENSSSFSYNRPLYFAVINSQPEETKYKITELLLNQGADINARMRNGSTFLETVAFLESEKMIRLSIDKGADIAALDENGANILWRMAADGNEMVVRVLLEKGADKYIQAVYWEDQKRYTPLEIARKNKHQNIEALLEK